MPSQITHQLFAEDTIRTALGQEGEDICNDHHSLISFAAQAADIFYHNRRTKPSSYGYGKRIHNGFFGRFVYNFVRCAVENGAARKRDVQGYIVSFTTHASIDRFTHPYILYHAGWVELFNKESHRYHRMHAFLERLLDMDLLETLRGRHIKSYDFRHHFDIQTLPSYIKDIIVRALHETYPSVRKHPVTEESLESAVQDTLYFYRMTNPVSEENKRRAYERELTHEDSHRLLALFYPSVLPGGYDFMNLEKEEWYDACKPEVASRDSFLDLYRKASEIAAVAVQTVYRGLTEERFDKIEESVGNENLTDGRSTGGCTPRKASPFPLPEILEGVYKEVEQTLS